MTISTGNKVSLNYQSQEVSVTLCYQLEREDDDLMQVVGERAAEVAKAHRKAWSRIHDEKVREAKPSNTQAVEESPSQTKPSIQDESFGESACSLPEMPRTDSPTSNEITYDALDSTQAQQAAVQGLLRCTGLDDATVAEMALVPFSSSDLQTLNKGQASKVLLVLQRHEREKAQKARAVKS